MDLKNEAMIEEIIKREHEFNEKLISEIHDISLSLRAMSGRNVVSTNEPPKKEGYIEKYFKRSDPEDSR